MIATLEVACVRCKGELCEGDLRCAICGLPTPAELRRPDAPRASIVRCDGCGAAVAYDVRAQAPRCAFCERQVHVEQTEDPVEQAEAFLPFRVDREGATRALRAWLSRGGLFRPSDLAQGAELDHLRALYWPAWLFEAKAEVYWTADSNAGSRRADWAPHSGQLAARFDRVLVPASRGLTLEEADALIPHFDLDERVAAPTDESITVELFEAERSAARARVLEAAHGVGRQLASEAAPGSRKRYVRAALLLQGLDTDRVALPTWVLAFRYRDKLYRGLIHGQDPNVIVGKMPLSGWKVAAAILLGLMLAAAVLALVLGR